MSEDVTVDGFVGRLAAALTARGAMMASAESCTGGLVAAACTSRAGSSGWFERGVVSYSNAAKSDLLGVTAALIADGLLARSPASFAVAITGVAGPGGGTPAKPVGTVWIATAARDGPVEATLLRASGDRAAVRERAVVRALELVLARIVEAPFAAG